MALGTQAPLAAPAGQPVVSKGIDFSRREQECYQLLFAEADPEGSGRLGGQQAVAFLSRSGLAKPALKQIWDVADSSGSGWLDREDFSVALRLVAHAQSGRTTTPGMARLEPVELPTFEARDGATVAQRPVPRLCGGSSTFGQPAMHTLPGNVPGSFLPGTSPGATPVVPPRGRSPARADKSVPTARDLRKFGRLFCGLVGPGGTALDAARGAELLRKSGVASPLLGQVWNMADTGQKGSLTWPEFVLAMHLVHRLRAQLPLPPPGGLPADLLSMLASLQPAQSYAEQPSRSPRASSRVSSPFASVSGTSAAPSARSLSPGPDAGRRSLSRGADRAVPSSTDVRKYSRLFTRTLAPTGASSLTAAQAKELFQRSGLDNEALARVWDLSDMNRDSSLSWQEFVLAMHLIQRLRAQLPLPSSPSEIPQELLGALAALGPAQSYASLPRSRSTSRAQSPDPFASEVTPAAAPAPAKRWETFEDAPSGAFGDFPSGEPEPVTRRSKSSESRGRRSLKGSDAEPSLERDPRGSSDHRSSSRDRHDHDSHSAWGLESGAEAVPRSSAESSHFSFEQPRARHGGHSSLAQMPAAEGGPAELIATLVQGDRDLSKELRSSCDELHRELERLEDLCKREEQLMALEQKEGELSMQEGHNLTQQVEASQSQLSDLKRELQVFQCQSILLRRDSDHYAAEHTFLETMFMEGTNDVQVLQQSVEYLEQSNQGLVAHISNLQSARGEVLQQLQYEEDLLARERQEVDRIQQTLVALKGGGADPLLRTGRLAHAGSAGPGGHSRPGGFGDAVAAAVAAQPAAAAAHGGAAPALPCGGAAAPTRAPLDLREGV